METQLTNGKSGLNGNHAVRASERAAEKAIDQVSDFASEQFSTVWKKGKELGKTSAEAVEKHPYITLAGVAAVAFAAGMLLRRRN